MRNIYLTLFLLAFLNSSCESFLDVKSDKSLVVMQSVEDALALMDDYVRMNEMQVPSWGESVSDDYYLTESLLLSFSEEIQQFYLWNYQEYFGVSNDWGYGYTPIYNANLTLDILKKSIRTSNNAKDFDLAEGSALFFRAYYFYSLLVLFGPAFDENTSDKDLGIVLRLTSDFNVKSFRSTVKECFDQIESDLKGSIELLPDHPQFVTRPSKAAAYAALARLYLYKRDYQQALFYSDKALSLKSDLMNYNEDEDVLTSVNDTASPFKKFNKETIFYAECNTSKVYFPSGSRASIVDSNLYRSYDVNDLRRIRYFRKVGDLAYYRGSYTNSDLSFGGLSTNELYLIKAECLAYLKRDNDALIALDKLLSNRIENFKETKDNLMNSKTVLEYVREERRKELVFRGLRFSDLKRYNKEGANITLKRVFQNKEYVLEPNSSKYNLPLPSDLIRITGLEQN